MQRTFFCAARAIGLLLLFCNGLLAADFDANEATKTLHALFVAEWDYEMEQYPTWASSLGDRRWNDRWEDLSLDAILKRHNHHREVLAHLNKIDRGALTTAEQLNYDLFKRNYERRVEGFQYRWFLLPLNQLDGVQTVNRLAESLGDEMALYDDPYSKFGQLMYEVWRASRLVVDTGMHHLRWNRQKAVDFMVKNTAKQELEVAAEIDRYIVWPGQALAYKIGQLKISELRAKAKQILSDKFDIRDFHDELLKDGALPLDQLEAKMDAWIARQQSSGTKN